MAEHDAPSPAPGSPSTGRPEPQPFEASDLPYRVDPLTGDITYVVAARQGRPNLPSSGCPFCPGGIEAPEPYDVFAFPNRWPAIPEGRCEVVLYTSDHDATFWSLGVEGARKVVDLWAERSAALGARPDVSYVLPFENRGPEVGATIAHPHGQIYGYDVVPPQPRAELEGADVEAAFGRGAAGSSTGDDRLAEGGAADGRDAAGAARDAAGEGADGETEDSGSAGVGVGVGVGVGSMGVGSAGVGDTGGDRLVSASGGWRAWVPWAPSWPYELLLAPEVQVPDLPSLDDAGRDGLAAVLVDVLARYDGLFDGPMPYMLWIHQRPFDGGDWPRAWVHLHLAPLYRSAGTPRFVAAAEVGGGVFFNPVDPERAAADLRAARWPGTPGTPGTPGATTDAGSDAESRARSGSAGGAGAGSTAGSAAGAGARPGPDGGGRAAAEVGPSSVAGGQAGAEDGR